MKIVGHEMGRSILLFPAEEIRPNTGIYIPTVMKALQDRYGFMKPPDISRPMAELDREGYKFGHGKIEIDGQTILIGEFGIFSDGISVSCFDTEQADKVWDDIYAWSQDFLGFRKFIREPHRFYRSQLVVEFEQHLSGLVANFSAMADLVGEAMSDTVQHRENIEFVRIAFGMDTTKIPGLPPVPFSIERKIGASFESERYFCEASLPTRTHIETLQRIESSLSTGPS